MLKSVLTSLSNGTTRDELKKSGTSLKANGAGYGPLNFKPFKVPTVTSKRDRQIVKEGNQGSRKRKRG